MFQGLLARGPRHGLIGLGTAAVVVLTIVAVRDAGGAAATEFETATATRGVLVVSAGGVGRIVEATPSVQVYPRASGQIGELRVSRGDRVVAGETLAVLDDGGAAAATVAQAESEVATARLELRQLHTSVPSEIQAARLELRRAQAELELLRGGSPAARTRAMRLAEVTVRSAQVRLERLLAPPSTADVSAADAEVKRAEAALALLQQPQVTPLAEVVAAAEQAVNVARQNLARAQVTGTPAEISAANLELYRAQAELASLKRPAATPLPQEIAAAEAAVVSARENLARLATPNAIEVETARLELARARTELQQLRAGPSPASEASANQAIVSAKAKLTHTKAMTSRDLARERITAALLRQRAARASLELLAVRAPASGKVTALSIAEGASVDALTPIAMIAALDDLAVTVDLSEFDVAHVRVGQTAHVEVDALGGKSYRGKVVFVALAGTDTNGVVTFPVEVAFPARGGVKAGMNVSVRIVVAKRKNAVKIPLEAIRYDADDNPYVVILNEETLAEVRRPVTLGLASTTHAEVIRGLRSGAEVVLAEPAAAEEEE